MKKKKLLWFLIFPVVIAAVCLCVYLFGQIGLHVTVVEPTCTENGYTIYEKDGKTQIKDIVNAKGHQFGAWVTLREAGDLLCGLREHTCTVCGVKEEDHFYKDSELPRLFFEGDISGIGKTAQVKVSARFSLDGTEFDGYALLKYQGHSSLAYEKKNFTVKFYEDEDCDEKKKFTFLDWNPENKFILKANYTDVSRARNLICADVWSEMVSSRAGVHDRLSETSNNGAVDGFPMSVYLNNEFIGVYNLTLHKDDGLFSMEDGRRDGIVIINKESGPDSLFLKPVDWETTEDWEIEYCGTEDTAWIKEKLNRFMDFVIHSSDEKFRQELSDYADVDSMVDYLIAIYALGLHSSYAKDLIFCTYDDGPWIASLFDMENAFGLAAEEGRFLPADAWLPVWKDGMWSTETGSLLWDRFLNVFRPQILARYASLREGALQKDALLETAARRIEALPEHLNQADLALYPGQPLRDVSHSEQISSYVSERLALLDGIFDYNTSKGDKK